MKIHFGHLGNGTTCYDVDRTVNHDYPTIAHISNAGNIHWYKENCKSITPEAKKPIESFAAKEREKYREYINRITYLDYSSNLREVYKLIERLPFELQDSMIQKRIDSGLGMIEIIRANVDEILNYL